MIIQKNSHRVSQLRSVALTNTPAINGMVPIVNSEKPLLQTDIELDDTQKKICRMLNISESDFIYNMWGNVDG